MAKEVTFKLKKGTEFNERFAGLEARYNVPETLEEVRALFDTSVTDVDAAIVAGFNGQGYSLGRQKRIKDILGSDAVKDMTPEEGVAFAAEKANAEKLGAPRTRGDGTKKDKVAKAEAKAEAATTAARDMYLKMPAALRKQFRPTLLAQGTFTEAELDEMDKSAK